MQNGRRSGKERRKEEVPFHENRRSGSERREVLGDPDRTAGRLRRIPMFDGLTTEQLNGLLTVCAKKTYARNERIFLVGDEAVEMFAVIQGKLRITFADGEEMESSSLTGVLGELGIITGERRTATVTAATECLVLSFGKRELEALFDSDSSLRTRVLTNVIHDLIKMLRKDNEILEGLRRIRSFEVR